MTAEEVKSILKSTGKDLTEIEEWMAEEFAEYIKEKGEKLSFPFQVGDLITGTKESRKLYVYSTDDALIEVTRINEKENTFEGKLLAHASIKMHRVLEHTEPILRDLEYEYFKKAEGKDLVKFNASEKWRFES